MKKGKIATKEVASVNASFKDTLDRNLPTLLVGGVVICVIAWYLFAFVIPNHPARPRNVPKSATLVPFLAGMLVRFGRAAGQVSHL